VEATYKRKSCLRRGFWRGKAYQRDELIGGVARAGKKNFLPESTTWRQKFPADQRSIFVLNLHIYKHIVF
jgi:hypothetical protein